jgi:hypothetical protein
MGIVFVTGEVRMDLDAIGEVTVGVDRIDAPYLGTWHFRYSDSWPAVRDHLFLFDNWHLFNYLLAAVLSCRIYTITRRQTMPWQRGADTWVVAALFSFFFLFFWTGAALWATQATSVNRVLLHFVPALTFWMMTIFVQAKEPMCAPRK